MVSSVARPLIHLRVMHLSGKGDIVKVICASIGGEGILKEFGSDDRTAVFTHNSCKSSKIDTSTERPRLSLPELVTIS